jgi:hypothetical protein
MDPAEPRNPADAALIRAAVEYVEPKTAPEAPTELHVDPSPYLRPDGTLDMRRVRDDADDALRQLDRANADNLDARNILCAILDSIPA